MDIEDEETYLERINKEKCTKKTCNIEYHLSGGVNNSLNPKKYTTCGSPITLKAPTMKTRRFTDKEGRRMIIYSLDFIAWYTDENYTSNKKITKIEDKHCKTDGGTIKLYAKWNTGQPTADPDGTPPELLGNNENPNPLGDQNPQEGTGQEVTEDDENQTPQEDQTSQGGQNQQERTRQENNEDQTPQNIIIPPLETEESTEPDIDLIANEPDRIDNQCKFASDGVNHTVITPGTLAYVDSVEQTIEENGTVIQEKGFIYAGCKHQDGSPGGKYCWCALKAERCKKPEGCQESELEKQLQLWCQAPLGACTETCEQYCVAPFDQLRNQQ
jgi:hypothetical protein